MFKIGKHLSTEEYQTKIVPCIVKLFSSSDRNARFKLLTQIEHFVEHLSSKIGKYVLLVWAFTDLIQLTYSSVCMLCHGRLYRWTENSLELFSIFLISETSRDIKKKCFNIT